MTVTTGATLVLAALAMTACSGGSLTVIGGSSEYNTLLSETQRLSDKLAPLSATPSFPTTSTGATYQGVVIVSDDFSAPSPTGIVGTANLTANFSTPAVSGTGTGFHQTAVNASGNAVAGSGTPVPGSLNFASSSFVGTAFILDVNGTVQLDGTSRTINDQIIGSFFGSNAEMISAAGTDVGTTSSGFDVDIAIAAD